MAMRFSKMHGAGNDFVLIDLRGGRPAPSIELVRALGNRHTNGLAPSRSKLLVSA